MRIVDLTSETLPQFCMCLEEWSPDIREAGDHKARWCERMQGRGLGVKLALNDEGTLGGMIQYVPAEFAPIEGEDLYFILCIWVHGHRQGRGNLQGQGMGTALLRAAEADIRARGAKGVAAWGLILPVWMRAAWFKRHGYVKADRMGIQALVWKPFQQDARPPRWMRPRWAPLAVPGKVTVTSFINGWCPAQSVAHERARRAAAGFGAAVEFQVIPTAEPAEMRRWGRMDDLFIDGRPMRIGPPPTFEDIRRRIARRVRRLPPPAA
jgi:GNAT superfamily N-acetyltransferase